MFPWVQSTNSVKMHQETREL